MRPNSQKRSIPGDPATPNKIEIWNPETLINVDNKNINNDINELNTLADKIVI